MIATCRVDQHVGVNQFQGSSVSPRPEHAGSPIYSPEACLLVQFAEKTPRTPPAASRPTAAERTSPPPRGRPIRPSVRWRRPAPPDGGTLTAPREYQPAYSTLP